jgi:predicted ATP-grasp superfamily ATP-dependent carboligase
VLIAAASGRALAASARRGGYAPLVADFFADHDMVETAQAHVRLDAGFVRGMEETELLAALKTLADGRDPRGAVCGTGFEDRPELLGAIARRWPLLGNSAETVARVKDPIAFAQLCRDCDIAHPQTSLVPPENHVGWLVKRRGGAGGHHIRAAVAEDTADRSRYFQRHVPGTPVSALFIADGAQALVLGFSMQWCAPCRRRPYRYGGAARPALVAAPLERAMTQAVQRLASALSLVGLNSADFLVDGEAFHLLEINPRPGATLDIFEPRDDSLFAMHVAACRGRLPASAPRFDDACAAAILYAECDVPRVADLKWPDWTADRPRAGTRIETGDPVCTVLARAPSATAARRLVEARAAIILEILSARPA